MRSALGYSISHDGLTAVVPYYGVKVMPNERGRSKRDFRRAINNASRILDRLMWIAETYPDYEEWVDKVKEVCVMTNELKAIMEMLLSCHP